MASEAHPSGIGDSIRSGLQIAGLAVPSLSPSPSCGEAQPAPNLEKQVQAADLRGAEEGEESAQASYLAPYMSLFESLPAEDGREEAAMRAAIASHPLYSQLVTAHVECRKAGAGVEVTARLDELCRQLLASQTSAQPPLEALPQLDAFMGNYISLLLAYRNDLERPFAEAQAFCNEFESRLSGFSRSLVPSGTAEYAGTAEEQRGGGGSDSGGEDGSVGESDGRGSPWGAGSVDPTAEEAELKQQLKQRYQPYLSSLKQDCLKKRKKGKLPREATQALLNWWQAHLSWPYPSEAEKTELAEATGLDPKQINNWFINQRKRHWGGPKGTAMDGGNDSKHSFH